METRAFQPTVRYGDKPIAQKGNGRARDPRYDIVREHVDGLKINGQAVWFDGYPTQKAAQGATGAGQTYGDKIGKDKGWRIKTKTVRAADGTWSAVLWKETTSN